MRRDRHLGSLRIGEEAEGGDLVEQGSIVLGANLVRVRVVERLIKQQSSSNQVAIKWQSSGNRVVIVWQSCGNHVLVEEWQWFEQQSCRKSSRNYAENRVENHVVHHIVNHVVTSFLLNRSTTPPQLTPYHTPQLPVHHKYHSCTCPPHISADGGGPKLLLAQYAITTITM